MIEPLAGITVVDVSRVLAGPFATQYLRDQGARVIKVEPPAGDETRHWGPPFYQGESSYFRSCNRGKECQTLDFKDPHQRKKLDQLLQSADILVENFLPKAKKEFGLEFATLTKRFPKLIVASIAAFPGDTQGRPGYDFAIQALSGMMATTGCGEEPTKSAVASTDVFTALYCANGIQSALLQRVRTGRGAHVQVSLLHAAVATQANLIQSYLDSATLPKRMGNAHLQIAPYQLIKTNDSWIVLAIGNDRQWQNLAQALPVEVLKHEKFATNQARLENREELTQALERVFMEKTTCQWQTFLGNLNIPNAPIWNYEDLMNSEFAEKLFTTNEWGRHVSCPVQIETGDKEAD